ncbi:MAG TPA: hypothetical protein VG675_15915 [Bryobacteraceae bacterium]|nr:hypothetical protein [Bryobacteraceae bacterium]
MSAGSYFDALSPHARVATAVLPFLVALLVRIVVGKNRVTRMLLTLGTVWFTANILVAPYSVHMQQDIINLRSLFW